MEKLDAHSADFRQFFLVHYETLCIRAFRLVHDRNLSEDIVQDVFLMLWKRRTEIDFSRPVLPYLTTAVRNRSIDPQPQIAWRRHLRARYARRICPLPGCRPLRRGVRSFVASA